MADIIKGTKPISRKAFFFVGLAIILLVWCAPLFLNLFFKSIGFVAADMAGPRIVIRIYVLPIVLFLAIIPLIKITRRRLATLELSGGFLLLFPILPIYALAATTIIGGLTFGMGVSPLRHVYLLTGLVTFVGLTVFSENANGASYWSRTCQWVKKKTNTRREVTAATFGLSVLVMIIAGVALGYIHKGINKLLMTTTPIEKAQVLTLAERQAQISDMKFKFALVSSPIGFVKILIFFMLVVFTLRRLHTVQRNWKYILLFPFAILATNVGFLRQVIAYPEWLINAALSVLTRSIFNPTSLLTLVWFIAGLYVAFKLCSKNGWPKKPAEISLF